MATIKGMTANRVNKPNSKAIEQNTSAKITSDNDRVPPKPMGSKLGLRVEKFENLFSPCVSIIAQMATRSTSSPNDANDPLTLLVENNFCNNIAEKLNVIS